MIRRIKQADRKQLLDLLTRVTNFTNNEVEVAMELIDVDIASGGTSDYNVYVYDDNKKILGYHCTGRRPLTDAVFDMYWIVVDPDYSKNGIGKQLIKHAEDFVKDKNGRWILAETSSRENYTKTRNFYLRNNYTIISEIKDFYSPGDNLVVFGKYFNQKSIG